MDESPVAHLVDRLLTGLVGVAVVGTAILFGYGLYDGLLAIRTIPAQVSCRSQGLTPIRRQLSTRIRCAGDHLRQSDDPASQGLE